MENIILNIKIFLFIFASLSILRDIYGVCKVIALKEGKFEMTNKRMILLGTAISFVLTILITGF